MVNLKAQRLRRWKLSNDHDGGSDPKRTLRQDPYMVMIMPENRKSKTVKTEKTET